MELEVKDFNADRVDIYKEKMASIHLHELSYFGPMQLEQYLFAGREYTWPIRHEIDILLGLMHFSYQNDSMQL